MISLLYLYLSADFGVSAKNTKTKARRDSFIGTPYWYSFLSIVMNSYHILMKKCRYLIMKWKSVVGVSESA